MKTATRTQNEASKKFNPYKLKDYLTRAGDGVVIVDRTRLIRNEDDERLFYVILSKDYGWDYSFPETITMYLEEENGRIFGGAYELNSGRLSRRTIAVTSDLAKEYGYRLYSYDRVSFLAIVNNIKNS